MSPSPHNVGSGVHHVELDVRGRRAGEVLGFAADVRKADADALRATLERYGPTDLASYNSGAVIPVDGGWLANGARGLLIPSNEFRNSLRCLRQLQT